MCPSTYWCHRKMMLESQNNPFKSSYNYKCFYLYSIMSKQSLHVWWKKWRSLVYFLIMMLRYTSKITLDELSTTVEFWNKDEFDIIPSRRIKYGVDPLNAAVEADVFFTRLCWAWHGQYRRNCSKLREAEVLSPICRFFFVQTIGK